MNSAGAGLVAVALTAAIICSSTAHSAEGGAERPSVPMIAIDGPIGPATARYVKEAFAAAAALPAEVVILRMNTPGGLATSMREIIVDVLASPVPVVGYVAPSGAHAASAGTYILYATHLSAMAPGTNIGAATPVQIGGPLPGLPGERDKDGQDAKDDKPPASPKPFDNAGMAKVTNDAVALIRSLAELRDRNAEWAERAVREAATLSAQAALQEHVIDLVARDPQQLLELLDGRVVEVGGTPRRLATKGLAVEMVEPGWLTRLLTVITNPNVALILMLVGVYGLIFEFANPGAIAPGVVGTICLVLGLYALNLLPIDYTGIALILLGIAFLAAEAFVPSYGVLGIGGVAAFLLGAAIVIDVDAPGFQLSWTIVGMSALMSIGLLTLMLGYLVRSRRRPVRVGVPAMLGLPAQVLDWSGRSGHVLTQGERWRAQGDGTFSPGEVVEVAAVDGLILRVKDRPQPPTAGDGR